MDDETELKVKQVQAGEPAAYEYIVRKFQKQLFVYCWRMLGNDQEAEDAVQDILVRAFEQIGKYKPVTGFSAWLYKMAYHYCLNLIRRRNFMTRLGRGFYERTAYSENPAALAERHLFSEPLSRALRHLNAEERNVLVLRIFEEKSFEEIGRITGKSEAAVKKRYSRIKMKLKTIMEHTQEEDLPCYSHPAAAKSKA